MNPTITEKPKDTNLRNAEYYDMTDTFDMLYEKGQKNTCFDDLMTLIISEKNIRLAYRNIKMNGGSYTPGIDGQTIEYIKTLPLNDFVEMIQDQFSNYHPKEVRRIYIPKGNGKQRPLGIPSITDRIMQQCILQVLEPIMEAHFHKNSHGFRPNKSCESALAQLQSYIYRNKCYYVVDVDIKGFFDNVNHGKLLKQLWSLGIRDKKLLKIISLMLKAEISNEGRPEKGTPQGAVLSPLLANVVLNELDWWLSNQWMTYHVKGKEFKQYIRKNGSICSNERNWMRKNTKLKEFYFVRYADDFKIICKSYSQAVKLKIAVTQWLKDRLKLDVSNEKTKIVNLKRNYSDFLGFKIKVRKKSRKSNCRYTIISHLNIKAETKIKKNLKYSLKAIEKANDSIQVKKAVDLYNSRVIGIHNYYNKATFISIDMSAIASRLYHRLYRVLKRTQFLPTEKSHSSQYIEKRYGKSQQLKKLGEQYIVPISFVQHKVPTQPSNKINKYTEEGRKQIHQNLECVSQVTIRDIIEHPYKDKTVEFNDIIMARLAGQLGKCYITQIIITQEDMEYIYLSNKLRKKDMYENICIVVRAVKEYIEKEKCEIKELKQEIKIKKKGTIEKILRAT